MKAQATGSIRKPGFFQRIVSFFSAKTRKEHNKSPSPALAKKEPSRKAKVDWGHNKLYRKALRRHVFGGAAERMLARTAVRKHNARVVKLAQK